MLKSFYHFILESSSASSETRHYYAGGLLRSREWTNDDDVLHREDGPAYIAYDENGNVEEERWYLNGIHTRKDGPAGIGYHEDGTTVRVEDWRDSRGEEHRDGAPSNISYFSDGKPQFMIWFRHGENHRDEGPALILFDNDGKIIREQYFIKGRQMSKEEWEAGNLATSRERLIELGQVPGKVGRIAQENPNYPDETEWLFGEF